MNVNRRGFLAASAGFGLASATQGWAGPFVASANAGPANAGDGSLHSEFPSQNPESVREIVGASHSDFDRVQALVKSRPALAKASWDWGFGDWESALGAASHVGRPDIAEFLLANGARPSIFSAAMLGQLEVVRAFVEASPGVQRIPGPHGIPLLRHAVAGGEQAKLVAEYLESLGDADVRPETVDLSTEELERYVGTYGFGNGAEDRFVCSLDAKGSLRIARADRSARVLFSLGEHEFFPAGAEAVRIRFDVPGSKAVGLRIHDPDVLVTARRI